MKKHGSAIRVGFYANSSKFSDLRLLIDQRYEKDKGFARQMNVAAEAIKENQRVIYMGSNHACQQVCKQKVRRIAYPGIYVEHWPKSRNYKEALDQIRAKYRKDEEYARMLNVSAWHRMSGKAVYTDGKAEHTKSALNYALTEIISTKVATRTGWQWLHKRQDKCTKLLEWKKISREVAADLSKPYKELPLELMQVYGYQFDNHRNAWKQAAEIEKETALPNFVVVDEVWIKDKSSDMDLQDNPHFRNENLPETYQPELLETKVVGFEVEEVEAKPISEVHVPVYNVEPKINYKVDRGLTEKETHINQEYLEDLYELDRKSWNKEILDFLDKFLKKEIKIRNQIEHSQQLIADEQEVENYAEIDSGSILSLLEEQIQQTQGKAPCGVVGALAQARVEAAKREQVQAKLLQLSKAADMFVGKEFTTEFLNEIKVYLPTFIGKSDNSINTEAWI